jgi:hypothetical protein
MPVATDDHVLKCRLDLSLEIGGRGERTWGWGGAEHARAYVRWRFFDSSSNGRPRLEVLARLELVNVESLRRELGVVLLLTKRTAASRRRGRRRVK